MKELPKPTTNIETAKADMSRVGYCIIEDILSSEELESVRRRFFDQVQAEAEINLTHHLPDKKQLVFFLFNKGKIFRDILLKAQLHEIVGHVLGEKYLLSSYNGHINHPGGHTIFHRDQWWMPRPTTTDKVTLLRPGSYSRRGNRGHSLDGDALDRTPTISPAVVCNAMWMLDDFTVENGATMVVPGSHLSGREPNAETDAEANWVHAVGKAGSVVIFEGRVWHTTGINRTTETRTGLTTNFCAPMFRQQENYLLGTRPEVLDELSDEMLELIGFKNWEGYGSYENASTILKRDEYTVGELQPENHSN